MVRHSDYMRELPPLQLFMPDYDGSGTQIPIIFEEVFVDQKDMNVIHLSSDSKTRPAQNATSSPQHAGCDSSGPGRKQDLPDNTKQSPQNQKGPARDQRAHTVQDQRAANGQEQRRSTGASLTPNATRKQQAGINPEFPTPTSLSKSIISEMKQQQTDVEKATGAHGVSTGSGRYTFKEHQATETSGTRHPEEKGKLKGPTLTGFRKITQLPDGRVLLTELGTLFSTSGPFLHSQIASPPRVSASVYVIS